jgi:hypothetical protein
MNNLLNKLFEIPGMVNQKIMTSKVNAEVERFDSKEGAGNYVAMIYKWGALAGLLLAEYAIIRSAYTYFTSGGNSAAASIGSVLTTVLLIASAFPVAHIVRSRGEALGQSYSSMVPFVFGDFIKTNIRITGEIAAVWGLFAAFIQTLSFLFDNTLFSAGYVAITDQLSDLYNMPLYLLHEVLGIFRLNMVTELLADAMSFRLNTEGNYNGDFMWNAHHIAGVAGAYINVLIGLAFMYVNLAVYGFLYNIVSSLIKWVSSPSIPLSIRNK